MGISNFPSPAEWVLPMLVMNTVISVALVKNKLRSVLQAVGGVAADDDQDSEDNDGSRPRRVLITRYGGGGGTTVEWSVCLCGFEGDEEVSELSCKHFFHKGCLDKWFDNQHITCPLCRSII